MKCEKEKEIKRKRERETENQEGEKQRKREIFGKGARIVSAHLTFLKFTKFRPDHSEIEAFYLAGALPCTFFLLSLPQQLVRRLLSIRIVF